MLDVGYYMLDIQECSNSESKNIQYPETSIQNQPMLAMVFVITAKIKYIILYNYRVQVYTLCYIPG
jgi:hypothetical protein